MAHPHPLIVFTGGYSGEADISRKSARMVMNHMDRERFAPILVHIDADGWFKEEDGHKVPTSLEALLAEPTAYIGAFIMVHGTPGEDGKLQRLLEATGLRYTTGDAQAMALTFHKGRTTAVLREAHIPVARAVHIPEGGTWSAQSLVDELGLPCFVKPNETGSSIGIHKVHVVSQMDAAIRAALIVGGASGVIVESLLTGREFTAGVIPSADGTPLALPVTEISTHRDFFDFAAKYEGESEETTPANIPDVLRDRLQHRAKQVYTATGMRGMARVDMMCETDGEPHVIEINAVPGFSEASIIPQQAAAMGMTKTELISRIIDQTLLA